MGNLIAGLTATMHFLAVAGKYLDFADKVLLKSMKPADAPLPSLVK